MERALVSAESFIYRQWWVLFHKYPNSISTEESYVVEVDQNVLRRTRHHLARERPSKTREVIPFARRGSFHVTGDT